MRPSGRGAERIERDAHRVSGAALLGLHHAFDAELADALLQFGIRDDEDVGDARSRNASKTNHSMGRPQSSCSTFERALFMRVPLPAARKIARIIRDFLDGSPAFHCILLALAGRADEIERVAQPLAHDVAAQ